MKNFFIGLTALTLLLFMTGCGEQSLQNSKEVFVIGLDDELAPLGFRNEHNELVGFDIDLAIEVSKRMGVTFELKPIDWSKKREELTSGNIDIIWNGLDITDERREYILFSKPYMNDRQIFLVNKGNVQNIRSEYDLNGKTIGVQEGASSENYINGNEVIKSRAKKVTLYNKFGDAINALRHNEIDVFICDELVARYEMRGSPGQFEVIDVQSDFVTEMGIGFRKDDVELCNRVQEALDEVIADGTAKEISEKWFDADLIIR